MLNPAPDELPGDLPGDRRQRAVEARLLGGLLAQKHTADDGVDVLVLEHHLDGETVLDLLKRRIGHQLLLAGGNEQQPTVKLARHRLDEVLHLHRSAAVAADVLLHLIEDDQRRRDLATADVLKDLLK